MQRAQGALGPVLSVEAAPALALSLRGNALLEMPAKGMEASPLPLLSFLKLGFFGRHDSHLSNLRATWKKSYSERAISKNICLQMARVCAAALESGVSSNPGGSADSGLLIFRVKN